MKQEEDIFIRARISVPDDGFSQSVERKVKIIKRFAPPRRWDYRMPTLVVAVASVILIVVLSTTGIVNPPKAEWPRQQMVEQLSHQKEDTTSLLQRLFNYGKEVIKK
ncbi:MAG: hypothetical protein RR931_02595 [Mucinivorans sp.]